MARPWIEYVQSQNLPWRAGDLWGVRPGVESKVLSLDPDDGASSLLVRYPANWRLDQEGALSADEEFLVLHGALSIGSQIYREKSYAHLPEGYARGSMVSEAGAVVLSFLSRRPRKFVHSEPQALGRKCTNTSASPGTRCSSAVNAWRSDFPVATLRMAFSLSPRNRKLSCV